MDARPGTVTWTNGINYALFQAGWFVCVLGAASDHPWLASAVGLFLVLAHLFLVRDFLREGALLLFSLITGFCVDSFHIWTGVLSFPHGSFHPALPPLWILVLWMQFAMTLHYSLGWLAGRYLIGALLGGVSGALAYWGGVRFGAAYFNDHLVACLLQIGLSWALVLPIFLKAAEKTSVPPSPHHYHFH